MSNIWKRWQDWASVVIGVLFFVTPFAFGGTATATAAWTAYIGGALLVIGGLYSLSSPGIRSLEYAEVVLGVLIFIAPFVLGFTALSAMAWSAWVAGVLTVLLGGSVLLTQRQGALA